MLRGRIGTMPPSAQFLHLRFGATQRTAHCGKRTPRIRRQPERHQRLTPQHRVGPAEECGIPAILAPLDWPVEQLGPAAERIGLPHIPELLRRLDERHRLILEIAEHMIEEPRAGYLIGVEYGDEFAVGLEQRIVDVSGFGEPRLAFPLGASGDVADADALRGQRELRTLAVIENPGLMRVGHVFGGERGFEHQFERFVVGGDEYVHAQSFAGRRRRRSFPGVPHGECVENRLAKRVSLGERKGDGQPQGVHVEGECPSP